MKNGSDRREPENVRRFALLVNQIINMIEEKSENSVSNVIYRISWNDTVYRTFNEGVRLSWKYGYQNHLPGSLIDYIHDTHISFIVISLRKIYERKQRDRRSVNSIPTLFSKIEESSELFTRENYVCRGGYQYNEHPEENIDTWKENTVIRHRHKMFDRFCGNDNPNKRERADKIPFVIIQKLVKGNVLNENIEVFANKFLAHASAENNRPNENAVYGNVKLRTIENQIKRAIWGVQQLGKLIDHLVLTTVATPQFDPIENWCGSIFNVQLESKLRAYWQKRMDWWQKWFNHYWMGEELFISPQKSI